MKSSEIIALLEEGKKVTKKSFKDNTWKDDAYVVLEDDSQSVYSWEKKYIRIHGQTCSTNYVMQSILSEPEEWEEYFGDLEKVSMSEALGRLVTNQVTAIRLADGGMGWYKINNGVIIDEDGKSVLQFPVRHIVKDWYVK